MKKLFLLFGILLSCVISHAQTLTGPSSATTGSVITIKGSGESVITGFIYSISYPNTLTIAAPNGGYASDVSASIQGSPAPVYFNTGTSSPTTFSFKVTSVAPVPVAVTFKFTAGIDIPSANPAFSSKTLSYTITINPPAAPTVYWNTALSGTLYNNTCSSGSASSPYNYSIAVHTISSTVSVADANLKAIAAQQTLANANSPCNIVLAKPVITGYTTGTITNPNVPITVNFTALASRTSSIVKAVDATTGTAVTTTVDATATSAILSLDEGHSYAITVTAYGPGYTTAGVTSDPYSATMPGTALTYENAALTIDLAKNDCSTGYNGTHITTTVPANTFSSLISQADADAKAKAFAQTNANNTGTCLISLYAKLVSSYVSTGGGNYDYVITVNFYLNAAGQSPWQVTNYPVLYTSTSTPRGSSTPVTVTHNTTATGYSLTIYTAVVALPLNSPPPTNPPPPSTSGFILLPNGFYKLI